MLGGEPQQVLAGDPAVAPGNFFQAGDFQALPPLHRGDEIGCVQD